MIHRLHPVVREQLEELYEVAVAMLEGSYWQEDKGSGAPADNGAHSDPHFWE